ncbi:MAG: cytidylate kinase-like family protein [Lachnospiraceae bacterium]|nr:cytidylate kinase-like family protein [Lachnospiraceae bacterium]
MEEILSKKNIVITVSRIYGSGGHTISKMLSEKLSIPYYDKDLIKLASEESGINESLFADADEKAKASFLRKIVKDVYNDDEVLPPSSKDYTSEKNLFNIQANIIKKLADRESCIIIGRCAEYILKDYDNVLSVFIHAPMDYCIETAARVKNLPFKGLEDFIRKDNKRKEDYHLSYTGKTWTDARNYDLCLDSSKLGFDRCVDEIIAYLKVRFKD